MEREYYLYRHIRLDKNEPFYIGIGTKYTKKPYNFKTEYSRAFSREKRNKHWFNIVNKTEYEVEIVFECNNEEEIIRKEIEFIKLYGRKDLKEGTLCNLTDGGLGITSYKHSDESKLLIGKSSKERNRRKGYKLNLSEEGKLSKLKAQNNKIISQDAKNAISKAMKGNKRGIGHIVTSENRYKLRCLFGRKVIQMTLDKTIIKIWDSLSEIHNSPIFDKRGVKRCCDKKTKEYKNFYWEFQSKKEDSTDFH